MHAYTLEQKKEYLADLASEELEYLMPFVIVDPSHILKSDDYTYYPDLTIDLAKTKAGDIISFIREMLSGKYKIVVFNNIDKISSRKDRNDWEYLIIKGLKEEDSVFVFDSENGIVRCDIPFSSLKMICTCSTYPDFLKKRGKLGWVGADFSEY